MPHNVSNMPERRSGGSGLVDSVYSRLHNVRNYSSGALAAPDLVYIGISLAGFLPELKCDGGIADNEKRGYLYAQVFAVKYESLRQIEHIQKLCLRELDIQA